MNLPGRVKSNTLLNGRMTAGNLKIVYTILFFCPALVYLNSSYNSFHLDDFATISHNPYIRSLENIPSFFTNPKTFSVTGDAMYRPALLVTYVLNYLIGGEDVLGYHIVNIALHSLNTVLVFMLLYQVVLAAGGKKSTSGNTVSAAFYASFWPAMFFGVHTVNTQAVNYISSRSVLLVTFFYLAAFNLYTRSEGRPLLYLLSFISYILSALSKEIAVTFPVMVFAYCALFEIPQRRSAILRVVPFISVNILGLYLAYGLYGLGGLVFTKGDFFEGSGMPRSPWSNLLTQAVALVYYIKLFILPSGLALVHNFTVRETIKDPLVISSVFFVLICLAGSLVLAKKHRVITFGFLWFLIAFIPETVIPLNIVINEHRTYLPFSGFLLMSAGALLYLFERRPGRFYVITLLLTAAAIGMGVNTFLRNQVWRSDITFLKDNILKAPESEMISDSLTDAYINAGESEKAIQNIERALRINPARSAPYYGLGVIYLKEGEYVKSIKNFRLALRLKPEDSHTLNMLGIALLNSGQPGQALMTFQEAKKLSPVWDEAHYNLGRAHLELAEFDSAVKSFKRSIELNPRYFEAYNNLGLAYMSMGNLKMALEIFEKALKMRAESLVVLNNIAVIYLEKDNLEMAFSLLGRVSNLDPLFRDGLNTFGEYYLKSGDFENALGMFEKALSLKDTADVHWNAAVAAERGGKIGVAVRHWESFLEDSPGSPETEKIRLHILDLKER